MEALPNEEAMLIHYLWNKDKVTTQEAAIILDIPLGKAKSIVASLHLKELVIRVIEHRLTTYKLHKALKREHIQELTTEMPDESFEQVNKYITGFKEIYKLEAKQAMEEKPKEDGRKEKRA